MREFARLTLRSSRRASRTAGSSTRTVTTRFRCTSSNDQRGVIMKSMDIIEKFWGKQPRGWFGPGLTQTYETLDYLAEAGVEYIGDWVLDDRSEERRVGKECRSRWS